MTEDIIYEEAITDTEDIEDIESETDTEATGAEEQTNNNGSVCSDDNAVCEPIPKPSAEETIQGLRDEISTLQALLKQKEEEQERILTELGEFDRLFPNISIKDLPDSVWANVEKGIPLSAAYALFEREESIKRYHAKEINEKNARSSAGKAGNDTASEYFSPDEVRAMSRREVHENYSKIQRSMKYWR